MRKTLVHTHTQGWGGSSKYIPRGPTNSNIIGIKKKKNHLMNIVMCDTLRRKYLSVVEELSGLIFITTSVKRQ